MSRGLTPMGRSKKITRAKRGDEGAPKRQTQTFGISALFLAAFTLLAMGLTYHEDAVSPMEVAASQIAEQRENPGSRFNPNEPFQFPISRDFAAISFAMIIVCIVVISFYRGESPWWGILALGTALTAVFLERWAILLALTLAIGTAVEVVRRARRRGRISPA